MWTSLIHFSIDKFAIIWQKYFVTAISFYIEINKSNLISSPFFFSFATQWTWYLCQDLGSHFLPFFSPYSSSFISSKINIFSYQIYKVFVNKTELLFKLNFHFSCLPPPPRHRTGIHPFPTPPPNPPSTPPDKHHYLIT